MISISVEQSVVESVAQTPEAIAVSVAVIQIVLRVSE
jgi:hypothetical protein